MSIVTEIRAIQARSANAWEMAVETAGPEYAGGSLERATEMQSLSDASDEAYEAAIDDIEGQYEGWAQNAKIHLEEAKGLESDGGDCSHAREALEALADYLSPSDDEDPDSHPVATDVDDERL